MRNYVLCRLGSGLVTLIGISLVVFFLVRLVPGDVVSQMIDMQSVSDPEREQELRRFFGLDQPWYVQYGSWLGSVVTGNLGTSWRLGIPVAELIGSRFAVTLELTILAMLVAVVVGVPCGVLAAVQQNRMADNAVRLFSLFGLSVPVFWQGSMLILTLSLYLHWTPPMQWTPFFADPGGHLALVLLPTLTLGTASTAVVVRMTRNALLEVMNQDFIRTARSKGLQERLVLFRHALKNALIPILTVSGLQVGYLLGGSVVVEEVFTLPGVGRLLIQSLSQRDYPVVQTAVLLIAGAFMLINLLTDVAYGFLEPRIRYR